ncbi:hypothetical protein CH371_15755 [Leptospira wolffii]|uniref:Uncharacterized protein n=1 Tax=Leptospira wolffii TaxID=409998 RepID=A0A2M9Z964_9LEPT|nr:hypothetical protein [Leptospira wolffii]PJZ64955.1 hypothetical protein CH371_15755 [Leptospira wolffii]
MNSKGLCFIGILTLFLSSSLYPHGEDIPGPNSGKIRMPGPFHTEVVRSKEKEYKIFLLDMDFKNPTVSDSTISARIKTDKGEKELKCSPIRNYFLCKSDALSADSKGELILQPVRSSVKGMEVRYDLPLLKSEMNSHREVHRHGE